MQKRTMFMWHGVMVGVAMFGAAATWWAFSVMPEIQAQQKSSSTSSVVRTQTKSSITSSSSSGSLQTPPATTSSTTVSTGDGVDDFGACTDDARLYCSEFYTADWQTQAAAKGYITASWKLGLLDCLGKNIDATSEECDISLVRRADLNADVNTVCASERASLCPGVKPVPGSEAGNDCLKSHYSELSLTCAAALDAHEAAKRVE